MEPVAEETQAEKRIKVLLAKMTLKEKASQMLNIGLPTILKGDYWDERDSAVFDVKKFKKYIIDLNVGSIHNTPGYLADSKEWYRILKTIQDAAIKKSRLGIPILYGIDNIHGANYVAGSVMFPHQIALAATWNPELTEMSANITSYESKSASLPWNFNPNADVAMSPLWGRISESFGEDPHLVSEMTNAYVRGSQQNDVGNVSNTAVCLKHFLGYGAGRNGKDRANAIIPEINLRQYFLPPFENAIKEGAMGVMISSNAVNGVPCHSNRYYITDILKGELRFKGVVISDFSDVEFLVEAHQTAKDLRDATKQAVNAGLDLIMNPFDAKIVDVIVDLVEKNEIPIHRIDDAVTRVLRLKFQLNLFDVPYNNPSDFPKIGSEKHIAENYKTASEAITLLKNTTVVLPLNKKKKVLVTGYAANSINRLNGAWSRTFLGRDTLYNDHSKLTILEAIQKEIGSSNVEFAEGTSYLDDINTKLAIKKAKKVDYIVVCVGEIPATEKPSDINELDLPKVQQELVKKLSKTGKPIILVMVQGRPRIMREIEPLVDAVIMAYLPGQEGGKVISDVLFGKINPSGKLPYTYPKYSGNYLTYYHKKTDIRDVNWGFDGFYPQYEFGYGLSYTNFKYSKFTISKDTLKGHDDALEISVQVKNTGKMDGKEVVELFIKDMVASVSPDSKKLVGFQKIKLKVGASKTVKFRITSKGLSFVGMDNKWIVEEGEFEIYIGGNPLKMKKKKIQYHH
ncbi:MAG: beta-glucosidase [Lutibacter sp.]|uniref:glycoside hydrolase family 3 N-terminal domain-containing protein n=1 Tax=Lutibacter sp. TaxID=1925666 RepID=UPI00184300B4|nr:glycoside hydrolase family 3 N-terminal domain-containing protein [Lutibacter sp.]MBT8315993.1 glycoside hydrolase family 3 C-terminal domain-containing protein [Lutibacter sp.]NNJ56853.1 beta-glucosidase [Lutibacter sp.]